MDLLEKMKILNSPLEKEWDFETERQKDSLIKTIDQEINQLIDL